jgi:hypothetical protein
MEEGAEADDLSLYFEQFETLRHDQEKDFASTVDAEKEFLFHGQCMNYISTSLKGGTVEIARRHFRRIAEFHSCVSACKMQCLPRAMRFSWNGEDFYATGDVYVCPISGNVHMCGQACSRKTNPGNNYDDGDICCKLTGVTLCKVYSMGTTRKEDNILVSAADNDGYAPMGFESTMAAAREKLSKSEDIYVDLSKAASCDYYVAEYVFQRHPALDWSGKVEMCKMVKKLKMVAETEYDKMIVKECYTEHQRALEQEAKKKFMAEVCSYVNNCISRREMIEYTTILSLFHQYEYPIYENVYLNVDIKRMNNELKHQVIWQVVDAWLKLKDLDVVRQKNMTFKECVSGFLHYMSSEKGLTENIVLHPETQEPFKSMDAELNGIVATDVLQVTFIPKTPGLVMASMSVIKAVNESNDKKNNASRSKRQRTIGSNALSAVGRHSNKIVLPGKGMIPGQGFNPIVSRIEHKPTRILPSMMNLQQLLNNAVKKSKTLEELLHYCITPI